MTNPSPVISAIGRVGSTVGALTEPVKTLVKIQRAVIEEERKQTALLEQLVRAHGATPYAKPISPETADQAG